MILFPVSNDLPESCHSLSGTIYIQRLDSGQDFMTDCLKIQNAGELTLHEFQITCPPSIPPSLRPSLSYAIRKPKIASAERSCNKTHAERKTKSPLRARINPKHVSKRIFKLFQFQPCVLQLRPQISWSRDRSPPLFPFKHQIRVKHRKSRLFKFTYRKDDHQEPV